MDGDLGKQVDPENDNGENVRERDDGRLLSPSANGEEGGGGGKKLLRCKTSVHVTRSNK